MTEWRPVVGFEDQYEVSSDGRVRRLARTVLRSNGHSYTVTEKELALCKLGRDGGYSLVGFKVAPGVKRTFLAHRLVAQAFLSNPYALPEVNHKNMCKSDNRVENLEWCSGVGNQQHAAKRGRFHGHTNPKARFKLQPSDVATIRAEITAGRKQCDIAVAHGVSQSMVSMIKRGHTWADPAEVYAHVA